MPQDDFVGWDLLLHDAANSFDLHNGIAHRHLRRSISECLNDVM
ncbi:hypothetical protein BN2537_3147 [Streptomyces venezuelae]|nr:hypothetical protein BN2537_3147 [Streptomyces venezuelae]